jgi:hypothetical protein
MLDKTQKHKRYQVIIVKDRTYALTSLLVQINNVNKPFRFKQLYFLKDTFTSKINQPKKYILKSYVQGHEPKIWKGRK